VPEEPSPDRKSGFMAFWTTLPGILTGVAALITAIVGAIGLWKSQDNGNSSSSSPATVASVTTTATTATGTTKGAASGTVRGRVSLARGDNADLEDGQIGFSSTADVQLGPESTPNLFAAGSAFLAPLEGPPTKRNCRAALSSRHDTFVVLPQLDTSTICVSTSEGNVAFVRVLHSPGVGNAKLVLGYTVWR
jgi:hypothetical protein